MFDQIALDDLIGIADDFSVRAENVQRNDQPTNSDVKTLVASYQRWYADSLAFLPDDLKEEFTKQYQGSTFFPKIRAFLSDPLKPSALRNSPSPWQYPAGRCFIEPLNEQKAILYQALARLEQRAVNRPTSSINRRIKNLVAVACKDYFTLRTIDLLFTSNGCEPDWWKEPIEEDSSERMMRAYGWFKGIDDNASSDAGMIVEGVVSDILDNESVDESTKRKLQRSVGKSTSDRQLALEHMHPRIVEVSGKLYEDGHYRNAILDACIALITDIKEKSGRTDIDGTSLIEHVFSAKNPILKLSEDKDERLGYMWLYSGAVMALRNRRGHFLDDVDSADPLIASEWLAFLSALFRLLDEADVVDKSD